MIDTGQDYKRDISFVSKHVQPHLKNFWWTPTLYPDPH